MKIAIIGGGSLGMLFSYYLSPLHEVTLYTRTREQSEIINSRGIHMVKAGKEMPLHNVKSLPVSDWQGIEEMTIIAIKQYHLSGLLEDIKAKATGSLFFLQNGYGHIKQLSELPHPTILLGSVEHGAVRSNSYTVYHNGEGVTRAAVYKGNEGSLLDLSASVASTFPIIFESDYKAMLIKKLVVNAVINPLTALLRVKNGELVKNPYYFKVFRELFEECAAALDLEHVEDYFENVVAVCEKTADNHSSMFKDIENGRQTEIDAILGYLLEEADRKKIKAPLIHNYYHCIKGKEHEREGA